MTKNACLGLITHLQFLELALAALSRTYSRLVKPGKWTKGSSARDEDGNPISHESLHAKKFDVFGALFRETMDSRLDVRYYCLTLLDKLTHVEGGIVKYNDASKDVSSVLFVLNKAMTTIRKEIKNADPDSKK